MDFNPFTVQDMIEYRNHTDNDAAYNLVLLGGPDAFVSYKDYETCERMFHR